jgi:ribulose-phosphate 3-epimerase
MYEIIPSPGTQDKEFEAIEKKLLAVKGLVKTIHIDVIDGKFADNTTFSDPTPFAKYANDFNFEIHLMVHEPHNYLKAWADIGAKRFIGQIEKMSDQVKFVADGQLLGEVGLGLDLDTPVSEIKVQFDDLDSILVMGVKAGFSGQSFNEDAMVKVRELRERTDIAIEVDGGINDRTIHIAKTVGANRFVATSFLFDSEKSPQEQLKLLNEVFSK